MCSQNIDSYRDCQTSLHDAGSPFYFCRYVHGCGIGQSEREHQTHGLSVKKTDRIRQAHNTEKTVGERTKTLGVACMSVQKIHSKAQLEKILEENENVLIDFFAEWCGACRMLEPVLKSISQQYGESLIKVSIDIDENEELADAYRVQSVPLLLCFHKGKLLFRASGYRDEAVLGAMLDRAFDAFIK